MSKKVSIVAIVATGILWGLSEIFLGDVFYKFHIPMRAASLTAIGIALLIIGRLVSDRPGSSVAAALIAGALRCLVPKLYICHYVAIGLQGCAFDASWTALKAGEKHSLKRAWLSAAVAAYVGFLSFGFLGAYAFGFGRWVQAGAGGILTWSLRSGSFAAILLIGLVPVASLAARHVARRLVPART
jgi:hypothetical protein